MSEYKTEISHDDYLRALALFTMAHEAYLSASQFCEALNGIIMVAPEMYPGGYVDDAIYSTDRQTVAHFDKALKREGIKVSSPVIKSSGES